MDGYNITTDEYGHIRNGLRADIMRCCMENKNLLSEKGSIYVGTGEKITIGTGTPYEITIAKTKALSPGNFGEILMVKNDDLCYSKLSEENFSYDSNGVVLGDVGSINFPVAEACFSLKENLYTTVSHESISGHTATITLPINFTIGYLSIVFEGSRCYDFGFLYGGFNEVDKIVTLYPLNYGEDSNFSVDDPNFIFLSVQRISLDTTRGTVTLGINVRGPAATRGISSLQFKTIA